MEIWKKIEGYNGQYSISNKGRLKSQGNSNSRKTKILKGGISKGGYHFYTLIRNNKLKRYYAHRLVAIYFNENPNNYLEVNHVDSNKLNNNYKNLEWVSPKQNIRHGFKYGNINRKHCSKPCVQLKNGKHVASYKSLTEASIKTGIYIKKISKNCKGVINKTNGFVFKFV